MAGCRTGKNRFLQFGKEAFCLWNQKMKYVAEPEYSGLSCLTARKPYGKENLHYVFNSCPAKLREKKAVLSGPMTDM